MLEIRRAREEDFTGIWPIIHDIFQKGDTYPFSPDTTEEEGFQIWMTAPCATYVAISAGRIVGTYYLKPNQPGLGAHVCNAGYAVAHTHRDQGIGRRMCRHSLSEARKLGFGGMQFNLVVSTNRRAVNLWQSCGFHIVGTLPKAFLARNQGLVDAFVMYRWLE